MKVVLFYHSLVSDWNNGHAHFLRGIAGELLRRGHEVRIFEPENNWSFTNLLHEHGSDHLWDFRAIYPGLDCEHYDTNKIDLDLALDGVDLVLVHEWNDPGFVARIGRHRAQVANYTLLFHDTHHRIVSKPTEMKAYDLRHYDGVLAFGKILADLYQQRCLTRAAWTWHEAADTSIFKPHWIHAQPHTIDSVWVGNWGDDERGEEIEDYFIGPINELGLRAEIFGVRYPEGALERLAAAGITYRGWTANFHVPEIFGRAGFTVHIPRRPYRQGLPGIPTIRIFEALACGIPLISAPWDDVENLFSPGEDFLLAHSRPEMIRQMRRLLCDPELAQTMSHRGLATIRAKHTCTHRVNELENILSEISQRSISPKPTTNETARGKELRW